MIIRFELHALGPYVSAAHWFVQGYGADFVSWLIYCLAAGVGAVLVGMIGFGSSLVILPVLLLIFPTQFDPEVGVRLAVGTTMASMVFGALSAGFAQTRHRTVCWPLLRLMIPAYLVGAVLGPWLSRYLPVEVLGYYIVSILVVVSIQTLRRRQPVGERRWEQARVEISLVHLVIGLMSSVAGIASGAFAIPYLSRFALSLRTAIGTSTVAAACYSMFATLGHVSAGWGAQGLPDWSLGFVYLPVFAVMSVTGAVCGLVGVKLGARVSENSLRRLLAVFLIVSAVVIAVRS